jgi:hypothetical protein
MNLIDVLAKTPDRVRALIDGRREECLSFKSAPEVFSLKENVLHLRDIDVEGFEPRVIRILSEIDPRLPDVDGASLARERNYNAQPIAPALEALATSRARSIERLRAIAPSDFERTAELEGVGRITLRVLLERWVQHDVEHLAEMSRAISGV